MWEEWLIQIGYGLLWLFAQPLLYVAIILSFALGSKRIKQDRKQFGHRVFPYHSEWKGTWLLGVLVGLALSVGLVLSGLFITWEWLIAWTAVTFMVMLTGQIALLSPVYTLGITILAIWSIDLFNVEVVNASITSGLLQVDLMGMVYLMLALFLLEIGLMSTTKRSNTFPRLQKSDRGKEVGAHQVRRLMLIPLLIPIPTGALTLSDQFVWWPVFGLEGVGFSFVLFPYVIGLSQKFRGLYSDQGAKRLALSMSFLAIILIGVAVGTYGAINLGIIVVVAAILIKPMIHLIIRNIDVEKRPVFKPEPDAIAIVGVVPGSPADDMGLMIGEKVERVHDIPVKNEYEFFDVMSENRTYCKLAVRDLNGETRFVQRPIYEGEDHELGLIFVKEKPRFTLQSETIELDQSS
ncbi:hypothetical protein [Alkalibacillus silvisoli]|uniref:PDZ domain-containing protein n=1 Tax=Alkalibacillus silvisoli TaxID=392823 RepID=A0ABN1ABV7_9BACI